MALYLGSSKKLKVISNGNTYYMNLHSVIPVINGTRLLSSDDKLLKDSNGLFLTTKDGD